MANVLRPQVALGIMGEVFRVYWIPFVLTVERKPSDREPAAD